MRNGDRYLMTLKKLDQIKQEAKTESSDPYAK